MSKAYLKNSLLKYLLTCIFFFIFFSDSYGQNSYIHKITIKGFRISADIHGVPITEVIDKLSKATGIHFAYSYLPKVKVYSKINNQSLEKGIKSILPLNTILIHSEIISSKYPGEYKPIKTVIILPSLKKKDTGEIASASKNQPPDSFFSTPTTKTGTAEAKYRHNEYQVGIETLSNKVEESVVAYHWLSQLNDPDFIIRLEAIKGLGELGSDTALQALYLALGDENETVREEAQNRLLDIDEQKSFQSIQDRLNSSNPILQNYALETIQIQRGDRWERLLEDTIQNKSLAPEAKKKAMKTLNIIRKN